MDPAAPIAGVQVPKRQEPVVFQFTPINGTNGNKRAMYAVISLEGELSWIKPAAMAVNPNQTNSGHEMKDLDFSNILTPDQLTDEVSKLDLGIEPDSRSTSQAVALANMTAGAMKSIGADTNYNNKPRFAVRAPIEVTGIFNASPDGIIQCRLYRLTDDGAVLHTVDNFTAFSPTRGRGGFPKFARLPAEIRDMVWKYAMPRKRTVRVRAAIPHEGGPGWLFKSYATSIPGIIQACSESRHLAMELITPAFEPRDAGYSGLVTYINLGEDMLAVPFNTAKSMTASTAPKVVAAREKVRNVMCYASTFRLAPWTLDIFATFVFTNSVHKWRQVDKWTFPGVKQEEVRMARYTDWVTIEFRRPGTQEEAEKCIRQAKRRVKLASDHHYKIHMNTASVVGLRICFTDNPPSRYGFQGRVHQDINPLDW